MCVYNYIKIGGVVMSKSFKLVLLAITACFLAYSNASAKTWWLPDWQGGQDSRGSADDGGGDIVKEPYSQFHQETFN